MLTKADGVIFGSPCIYADITDGMRSFLEHMERNIKEGRIDVRGSHAAIFGSYGWDGTWIMEERLKNMVQSLGYNWRTRSASRLTATSCTTPKSTWISVGPLARG